VSRRAAAGGLAVLVLGTLSGVAAAQDVPGLVGEVTSTVDASADSVGDQVGTVGDQVGTVGDQVDSVGDQVGTGLDQTGLTATQPAGGSIATVGGSAVGSLAQGSSGSLVGSQTGAGSSGHSRGVDGEGRRSQRVNRFQAKPDRFKNRGAGRKGTILTFWLARAGVVRIVVRQVSPDCVLAGRMILRGDRGWNRVRWKGRLEGEPLPPGTYRVVVRAGRAGERRIARETIVIVPRDQSVASARPAPSTCARQASAAGGAAAQAGARPGGRAGANAGGVLGAGAREEVGPPPPSPFEKLPSLQPEEESRGVTSFFLLLVASALAGLLAAAVTYGSKYINNQWNPFRRRYP
jgi:hypothetical protein